ncbi:hypothetical protein NEOLEDRAFT_1241498 [Neolentinus lepideus HHB14362 ss-1]|uniref:DUF6534 domain-containing protein n=1 Tax=Neolentinus lepideus HHB14362 ss-1 TaxID=1314782 RepID=A0A165T0V2_9AGAM|nr:hypothetical protein NEOLEDRAFT_1241498 [Neolentinus lepideus HHB14362 ss-1]
MSAMGIPGHNMLTLDNSLGALFLGILVSAILFGVTNAQAFLYFHECKKREDPFLLKSSVALLWLFDILHLVFIGRTFYWYAVSHFGNLFVLQYTTWSLTVQVVITGLSNFMIRGIFLERIWRLSNKKYIAPIMAVPAFIVLVLGFVYASEAPSHLQDTRSYLEVFALSPDPNHSLICGQQWMLYIVYACAMLTDSSIAVMNTSFLRRSRADAKPMDIPNVLVIYGINTGIISGLCSTCIFLTYAIMPRNLISVGFGFVLGKVYLNALLASLNARTSPKPDIVPAVNMTPASGSRPRRSFANGHGNYPRPPNFNISTQMPSDEPGAPIAINIETVTEQKVDQLVRDSGDSDFINSRTTKTQPVKQTRKWSMHSSKKD